jgi:hypothetical protein
MSGSESVAITEVGNIGSTTHGNIRIKAIQCYKYDGSPVTPVNNTCKPEDIHQGYNATTGSYTATGEELQYSYDIASTVGDFLLTKTDPYFILYNSNPANTPALSIDMSSTNPFSLPTLTVRSTASQ